MQNLILIMLFKVLLRKVLKQNSNYLKGQKVMFDSCVTRWFENLNSYSMFLTTFPYIIETRKVIDHKDHLEKYPEWRGWDLRSKTKGGGTVR